MNAHIEVLTGYRAGTRLVFERPRLTVGRHPDAALRFDPVRDLEVSTQHAVLLRQGVHWFVQDLASRNGTFVNGARIAGTMALHEGDRIQFGMGGPTVEFRTMAGAPQASPQLPDPWEGGASPTPPVPPPPPADPMKSTMPGSSRLAPAAETPSQEIRTRVARETRRLRYLVVTLSLALVAVVATAYAITRIQRAAWERELAETEAQIDSILQASGQAILDLEGRAQGLSEALEAARTDLRAVQTRFQVANQSGANDAEVADLRRQVQDAQSALRRHQLAAAIDFEAVEGANRPAIAKLFVEFGDGEIVTATAFAVGENGRLLTNRHAVAGAEGTLRPRRIGVQFADSRQVFPARVVATAPGADLALIEVRNIVGQVPTIKALNQRPDTLQTGSAVALIGFPLGGSSSDGSVARTTVTAGILSSVTGQLLRVNGYGVEGSSGSPVLDVNGEVIGILYGGRDEGGERVLFAVPATRLSSFLADNP